MITLPFVLTSIIVFFAAFLLLRSFASLKLCALCGAVSLTWIILLVLFYLRTAIDPVLIGVLMGGSVVGLMYLLEQKLPEKYQLFKLPFFLTLVALVYGLLDKSFSGQALLILGVIWILAGIVYAGRHVDVFKSLSKKIIDCCKNW